MGKVVYIIPGFKHSPLEKKYGDIAKVFKQKNFDVVLVKINWRHTAVDSWISQFLTQYDKNDKRRKYLFGFSYGALTSFIVSTKVDIDTQILCSLSPYFQEDLASLFKSWRKYVGKRRIEAFKQLEMAKLAPLIKATTYLLYGTHEGRYIETRVRDTYERLNCKKFLIPVKDAKHDIANPEYLKQIEKVIGEL